MAGELFNDREFLAQFDASLPRLREPPEGQRYYGDCYYRVDDLGNETLMLWFNEWKSAREWCATVTTVEMASASTAPADETMPTGFVRVKFT